jgi:hypothetical protein
VCMRRATISLPAPVSPAMIIEHCLDATALIVSRIDSNAADVPTTKSLRTTSRFVADEVSPVESALHRVNFPFALSIARAEK